MRSGSLPYPLPSPLTCRARFFPDSVPSGPRDDQIGPGDRAVPLRRQLHNRAHLLRRVENKIGLAKKLAAEVDDIGVAGLEDRLGCGAREACKR